MRIIEENILKWEIISSFFVIIVGSFLHFLFEISGYFYPIGAISAVNESVWEHLKLGFWPIIFIAPVEYKFIKDRGKNFIIAKNIAAYIIPLSIVIIFYTYTAILGTNLLIIDILTFIIAIVIGHVISYQIMRYKEKPKIITYISLILIIFLAILFVLFTYYPPQLPIFQDSLTRQYGIT
ncbi:MAG: DUF6512 family protein [Promethearchaeota archaeon]